MAPALENELGLNLKEKDDETGDEKQRSLESLADEAETLGALVALQRIALAAAPFRTARPNYAHEALAFLMWEGLVQVFSANWDECTEKAAAQLGFDLPTTVTDADRLNRFKDARHHKVHGCASSDESLMVTTAQIGTPPAWAVAEVQAALGGKTVVFLGLGTVGDYVATRIKQVLSVVPTGAANYLIVTPRAPSDAWKALLPDQADERHEASCASPFLDSLLRALWNRLTTMVAQRAAAMIQAKSWSDDSIEDGINRVRAAFAQTDALSALMWMRRGCGGVLTGVPAVAALPGETMLLGLAAVTDSRDISVRGARDGFVVEIAGRYVELAYWPGRPSSYVVDEESARIQRRMVDGHYPDPDKPVLHLCLDQDGPLPRPGATGDLVGDDSGDLVDPSASHEWLSIRGVLDAGGTPALD